MQIGSACFDCEICGVGRGCIAGHNDNYYIPASKKTVIERLDKGLYPRYRSNMIKYLKDKFDYDYEGDNK